MLAEAAALKLGVALDGLEAQMIDLGRPAAKHIARSVFLLASFELSVYFCTSDALEYPHQTHIGA